MKKYIKLSLLGIMITLFSACQNDMSSADNSSIPSDGKGGSTARFTVYGDYLYTVNNQSLITFDISQPANPVQTSETFVGWNIETIFAYQNNLYIGSSSGIYVFGLNAPGYPSFITSETHFYSCDPIVVSGNYAYVTLHSESRCNSSEINELDIYDISNLDNVKLTGTYGMTSPRGLGIEDTLLFVCDAGLKVFDINKDQYDNPKLDLVEYLIVDAEDLIALKNLLIITGASGISQYSYTKGDLKFLSSLYSSKVTANK